MYVIERSNTKYQDVQVYAIKSIRCLCVLSVLEHNHSMYVDHQNGELTSTSAHHKTQNDQEKLLALRCACHHTAKTYKHNYKHVLCHYRAYTTPTHFTRIDRKATSLITHLLDSSPDTRASSSASRNLPFVLAAFLENDRDSRAPQCPLTLRKLECKCKWKAHRNQSVSGNMQVVMGCNDKRRWICSLGVDQSASTANANITKQEYTI